MSDMREAIYTREGHDRQMRTENIRLIQELAQARRAMDEQAAAQTEFYEGLLLRKCKVISQLCEDLDVAAAAARDVKDAWRSTCNVFGRGSRLSNAFHRIYGEGA